LAFVAFIGIWRTAWAYRMEKMEAWWWLSVPYGVAFPLSVLFFRMKEFAGHALSLFLLIAFVNTLSLGMWALITIYRRVVSTNHQFTMKEKVMLAFAPAAAIIWVVAFTL
jgi:hypothetical protein